MSVCLLKLIKLILYTFDLGVKIYRHQACVVGRHPCERRLVAVFQPVPGPDQGDGD